MSQQTSARSPQPKTADDVSGWDWLLPNRRGPRTAYQPLVVVLAAVCGGIVTDRLVSLSALSWWAAAIAALAGWLWALRRNRATCAAALLLASAAAVGGGWHHCCWNLFAADDLGWFAQEESRPAVVEAILASGPRRIPAPPFDPLRPAPSGDRSRLELKATAIRDGGRWRTVSGRVRLMVDGHVLGVRAGDRVRVFGDLSAPPSAQNPGDFDAASYARAERRLCSLWAASPDCLKVVRRGSAWKIARFTDGIRSHGERTLSRHVGSARSGLAAALLLGLREQFAGERTDAFLQTGMLHVLSISGLHVGILAGTLLSCLRLGWLPRRVTLACVALLIAIYCLVTDVEPPVLRATVLVLIVCSSLWMRRPARPFNSLAFAALVVLAVSPTDLFNTGAQLSFLAVAALVWSGGLLGRVGQPADALEKLIRSAEPWHIRGLRSIARWGIYTTGMSGAVWLFTLPLVMAQFHLVSPVAIPLNVVLCVPIAWSLMLGLAVLLLGELIPPLASVCGVLCDWCLKLLESVVALADALPGTHWWTCGIGPGWLIAGYFAIALYVALPRWRPQPRLFWPALMIWFTAGANWPEARPADRLECTALSVGHGCAVVLELPGGQTVLYDAGQLGTPARGARTIAGFLWSRGISRIDTVIISHADVDHYNALPELLERFPVGAVYVSPVMFGQRTAALHALKQAIEDSGTELRLLSAGDELDAGDCQLRVLYPPATGIQGSDNANSLVVAVEYAGRRVLLPGDLDSPGLERLLSQPPLDCDVVLAPHHGGSRSNPPGTVPPKPHTGPAA
jgi:competence protein ComEC